MVFKTLCGHLYLLSNELLYSKTFLYLSRRLVSSSRQLIFNYLLSSIFSFFDLHFSAIHVFLDKISFWFLVNILNFNLTSPMPHLCFHLTHVKIFCSYVRWDWRRHQLAQHNPVADLLPMLLQEGGDSYRSIGEGSAEVFPCKWTYF